ncbi:MAG TPA: (Fe-S)-binding protein [Saprospiraceae bacterium]|jgi:heterodisulfide reductase subunit D|nr:(Fe-S)-binding protein [Saprospiraceae bacterium]HRP42997.1 (Fe-S)-binding protein [Saprospiraceae bacterium]
MIKVKTMAEAAAEGIDVEVLYFVGCAGSFDPRAQRITKAFAQLMDIANVSYAILGKEEMCTGDPARRAGNEFLFQMLANQNIQTMNNYGVKKIVTTCPHGFNMFKNEYPELGGTFEVLHHTQFLNMLIDDGKLKVDGDYYKDKKITYHDSCYLGRINGEYDAPRNLIHHLKADLVEMNRCKSNGLCCGAGGAQFFKEDEPGEKRINVERIEEALDTKAGIVASNCPFCITMLTDGIKAKDEQDNVVVLDVAELLIRSMGE